MQAGLDHFYSPGPSIPESVVANYRLIPRITFYIAGGVGDFDPVDGKAPVVTSAPGVERTVIVRLKDRFVDVVVFDNMTTPERIVDANT